MDKFWKWLMRANARGVFLGALLGFLLTIGWWTYNEYRPRKRDIIPGAGRRAAMEPQPLGIGTFLDEQMLAFKALARGNPFHMRQIPQRVRPPRNDRESEPEPTPQPPQRVNPRPPQPEPEPEPEPAPEPPAPTPVRQGYTIEYKGLFTRSDGSTAALLRDGKTGTSSFYPKGSLLHGMKIGRVTPRQVSIVRRDGSLTLLKLGEPEDF